ncbi:MAG TPA: BatD family protein [Proteiniphilum sp.]|nr:BatD family protein [Proteiniphilum sp.]HPD86335.1 BatD family protein [Proteiniphilum sp.]HPJ49859.1 BatD family protein [Proteiniphilum sp.]HPR19343.1 BatD family protein [Proteiniphilum sp.]
MLASNAPLSVAQVTFKATAPATVVEGEQFRLSYHLNKEGRDLRLPELKGLELLFGPSTSTSYSQSIINGKSTSEMSVTYTYILMASKAGSYTIPAASITVDRSNYQSNSLQIKVLPPDETVADSSPGGDRQPERASGSATVSERDAFIRAIVSKSNLYEQEGFTVTFRLYTTLNVVNFGKIQFPEFEGFMVEEIDLPVNKQLEMERYNGRNYYTADLRKTLLFPQRPGKITIPSGSLEMVFSVPSGKKVSSFFGPQEMMVDVKKALRTNPLDIDVKPLPEPKPVNYANAVGSFTLKPVLSKTESRANEAITLQLEISGTGNLKLIRNPEIPFPDNFEQYDPKVDNIVNATTNGLTGMRRIEYMVIPRYEGTYNIPPVEFTYFDPRSGSYKRLTTPEYQLNIAKGEPGSAPATAFVNRQDVKVEQDIRFLITGDPNYQRKDSFFVGSTGYWLWILLPLLLLITLYLIYRKQVRENANVVLMRNRKANKIAFKRLKKAEQYLRGQKRENFYEELLRALWGYFSDKLSIPVARLSRDNVETELRSYGISGQLTDRFLQILDSCEFARYAPSEGDAAMDKLYQDTLDAIGEMENRLKKSK